MGRTMNIQAPEPSDPVFIDGSQSPNDHINGAWVEDLYSNTSQSSEGYSPADGRGVFESSFHTTFLPPSGHSDVAPIYINNSPSTTQEEGRPEPEYYNKEAFTTALCTCAGLTCQKCANVYHAGLFIINPKQNASVSDNQVSGKGKTVGRRQLDPAAPSTARLLPSKKRGGISQRRVSSDEDSNDDQVQSIDDPGTRSKRPRKRFACLYAKADPYKYRACLGCSFPNLAKLRQHFACSLHIGTDKGSTSHLSDRVKDPNGWPEIFDYLFPEKEVTSPDEDFHPTLDIILERGAGPGKPDFRSHLMRLIRKCMTDIEFGNGVLEELDSLDPGSAQASDPDVSMTSDAGGEAYASPSLAGNQMTRPWTFSGSPQYSAEQHQFAGPQAPSAFQLGHYSIQTQDGFQSPTQFAIASPNAQPQILIANPLSGQTIQTHGITDRNSFENRLAEHNFSFQTHIFYYHDLTINSYEDLRAVHEIFTHMATHPTDLGITAFPR